MDSPGGRGGREVAERVGTWGEVRIAIRAYTDADSEDDGAFELARERLQAAVRAWVERASQARR